MLNYWMEVADPFHVLNEVRRQLDRAYVEPSLQRERRALAGWPRFTFTEGEGGYELRALVPGLDESTLKISATGSTLTVSGARSLAPPEDYTAHRRERGAYEFTRTFDLPSTFTVELEKIAAVVKNGVLRVSLPRSAESKSRSINVTAG
jgi:HSP20 family protein